MLWQIVRAVFNESNFISTGLDFWSTTVLILVIMWLCSYNDTDIGFPQNHKGHASYFILFLPTGLHFIPLYQHVFSFWENIRYGIVILANLQEVLDLFFPVEMAPSQQSLWYTNKSYSMWLPTYFISGYCGHCEELLMNWCFHELKRPNMNIVLEATAMKSGRSQQARYILYIYFPLTSWKKR